MKPNGPFRGMMFAWLITTVIVALLFCAFKMATANADPDTHYPIEAVAHDVCARLYEAPTVANFNNVVQSLWDAGNTTEQENAVMAYAMNTACPGLRQLAEAALNDALLHPSLAPPVTAPLAGNIGGRLY